MSAVTKPIEYKPLLDKDKLNDLTKKDYGLNDKDLEEISVFINDFNEAMNVVPDIATYEDLKLLVEKGNKIPAHCGYLVASYFANDFGDDAYNKVMINVYNNYKTLFAEDPESTKTTDLYETLACLIQFAPAKTMRKFLVDNDSISTEIYKIMRKRPSTNATMSARYAELFVTTKFNIKYAELIFDNYKEMINFLSTKNNEIDNIPDAVRINYNELRTFMQDFYERDKKENLKKINKLINKKADVGESFFYFVALNPSCALEVLGKYEKFTSEFITDFLYQLKIQYIVELVALLENLPIEKQGYLEYLKKAYKIDSVDSCYIRLSNLVRKDGLSTYGVLLRQIPFYPAVQVKTGDNLGTVCADLQSKLSSVANNLTADISEKSMSITIVPLGRSRIYQDVMDKIEGVDANSGGFAAKLRDKDIIKKIRESGLSWYTMDQYTGKVIINILQIIQDVYKANPAINRDEMIKACYKELVLKYGDIITLPYFKYVIEALESKMIGNEAQEANEDYEEM